MPDSLPSSLGDLSPRIRLVPPDSVPKEPILSSIGEELDAILAHDRRVRVKRLVEEMRALRSIDPFAPYALAENRLLLQAGEMVGRLTLEEGDEEVRILDLWINTAARGKGIEKRLVETIVECRDQRRLPVVVVIAHPDGEMAEALLAADFRPEGESETHRRFRLPLPRRLRGNK